jgi:hypothetical protein
VCGEHSRCLHANFVIWLLVRPLDAEQVRHDRLLLTLPALLLIDAFLEIRFFGLLELGCGLYLDATRKFPYGNSRTTWSGTITGWPVLIIGISMCGMGAYFLAKPEHVLPLYCLRHGCA